MGEQDFWRYFRHWSNPAESGTYIQVFLDAVYNFAYLDGDKKGCKPGSLAGTCNSTDLAYTTLSTLFLDQTSTSDAADAVETIKDIRKMCEDSGLKAYPSG